MLKNRNCVFTAWQIAKSEVHREFFTKEHGLSASSCVRTTEVLISSAAMCYFYKTAKCRITTTDLRETVHTFDLKYLVKVV